MSFEDLVNQAIQQQEEYRERRRNHKSNTALYDVRAKLTVNGRSLAN
jgi:hypothetical protein